MLPCEEGKKHQKKGKQPAIVKIERFRGNVCWITAESTVYFVQNRAIYDDCVAFAFLHDLIPELGKSPIVESIMQNRPLCLRWNLYYLPDS